MLATGVVGIVMFLATSKFHTYTPFARQKQYQIRIDFTMLFLYDYNSESNSKDYN